MWDPTYTDESWINTQVRLIPRMKELVAAEYPGTKTAITEYNWGALDHINGALAQADILGIFGREGLDLATLWGPPTASQPGAYAFRMYLNYDGKGGRFGETAVRATSADQGKLAVYAAERASDDALTLVVVNKTGDDLTSQVSVAGRDGGATAQVYRYSAADTSAIKRDADVQVGAGGFTGTFPANSISTIVIPASTRPVALAVPLSVPLGLAVTLPVAEPVALALSVSLAEPVAQPLPQPVALAEPQPVPQFLADAGRHLHGDVHGLQPVARRLPGRRTDRQPWNHARAGLEAHLDVRQRAGRDPVVGRHLHPERVEGDGDQRQLQPHDRGERRQRVLRLPRPLGQRQPRTQAIHTQRLALRDELTH